MIYKFGDDERGITICAGTGSTIVNFRNEGNNIPTKMPHSVDVLRDSLEDRFQIQMRPDEEKWIRSVLDEIRENPTIRFVYQTDYVAFMRNDNLFLSYYTSSANPESPLLFENSGSYNSDIKIPELKQQFVKQIEQHLPMVQQWLAGKEMCRDAISKISDTLNGE